MASFLFRIYEVIIRVSKCRDRRIAVFSRKARSTKAKVADYWHVACASSAPTHLNKCAARLHETRHH